MANIVNVCVLFFVAGTFVAIHCATFSENFQLWREHKKRADSFACEPRARSYRASELFEKLENDDNIIPWETILYRCDAQSGCCKSNDLVCGPEETEPVKLAFFSLVTQEISIYEATNHTSCSCHKRGNIDDNTIKK